MKKFNIVESEKSRILEMHKSLIKEQDSNTGEKSIKDQLQVFIDNGCFPNGNPKVVKMTTTNPKKQFAIKIESVKTPGKFRYFFVDNTVGQMEGGSFQFLTSKWSCDTNKIQAKKAKDSATLSASTENIEKTKKEGNWKTKEELLKSGDTEQNIENPLMYEKTVINGIAHYRRKASSGISAGLTDDQKSIIKDWESKGYKLRDKLTPEEAKTFKSKIVSPASEGYFSQDLVMYFDPNAVQGVGTGETKTSITTVIQNAVNNRIPTDKKDCKDTIQAFYISWKKKRPLEPNEFTSLKEKTQACKNEFYGDWGSLLSGGNKVDAIIDIMSGVKPGGPSSSGGDAQWRLN
jgi:hypothetical protein